MTTPALEPPVADPVPVPPVPTRPRSGSARAVNVALGAAVVVAVAGIAFALGRSTAPMAGAAVVVADGDVGAGMLPGGSFDPNGGGFTVGGGPGPAGGGAPVMLGAGGPAIEGIVESVSATSITIKLESGQTITVGLDSDTTYHQQADAKAADVSAGKTVILRIDGGFRPGGNGDDTPSPGTASDVTVVP